MAPGSEYLVPYRSRPTCLASLCAWVAGFENVGVAQVAARFNPASSRNLSFRTQLRILICLAFWAEVVRIVLRRDQEADADRTRHS